jgi:hypothetical protein
VAGLKEAFWVPGLRGKRGLASPWLGVECTLRGREGSVGASRSKVPKRYQETTLSSNFRASFESPLLLLA